MKAAREDSKRRVEVATTNEDEDADNGANEDSNEEEENLATLVLKTKLRP